MGIGGKRCGWFLVLKVSHILPLNPCSVGEKISLLVSHLWNAATSLCPLDSEGTFGIMAPVDKHQIGVY
jgi:hypothetical protein